MGDIQTHESIARVIIDVFRAEWPHEENYGFFELGNWLTDVSQFNDPYAMIVAKMRVWNDARVVVEREIDAATLGFMTSPRREMDGPDVNLDFFCERMLGAPRVAGDLPKFLRLLCFFIGCEWFRSTAYGIRPQDFDEIFTNCFTQYYPHEHLDFPPWPHGQPWGNRDPSRRSAHRCPAWPSDTSDSGGARRLLAYLDEQIEYVAELLTRIEQDWVRVNTEPATEANLATRRRLLTDWGHASHAVEDFFFHSNFIELAWAGEHPDGSLPTVREFNHHWQRRVYYRRRKSPVWDGRLLSRITSHDASRIYTGSFGGEDVFHTFIDALEGIPEPQLAQIPGRGGDMVRQLATPEGRNRMRDRNGPERKRFLDDWRDWADNSAPAEIRAARNSGVIDRLSADALRRALELDRASFRALTAPKLPYALRGPFAFFTDILCAAQAEVNESDRRRASLDSQHREAEDASDNGASAENIGSHTLMSKDSPRKPPLRQQAINLATWVASYIASVLARRLNQPGVCAPRLHPATEPTAGCTIDRLGAVDWLHLLQHFLCHPGECEQQWHLIPLVLPSESGTRNPNLSALTSHTVRHLTPSQAARRARLRTGERLAQQYRDLEQDAERVWTNRS